MVNFCRNSYQVLEPRSKGAAQEVIGVAVEETIEEAAKEASHKK
jgi:hypothetical protein